LAQGLLFDTGFNALPTVFGSTVAKATSLMAFVIGGYSFAPAEPT